jgi:N-acetylglucosamine malate deacetylase 1
MPLPVERVLVVAAHPDDEVLGCGGLLARVLRTGRKAHVLIMTEGSTTQYPDQPELVEQKQSEAREAMRILGGPTIDFAGLPDMALSTLTPAELNGPIEAAVREHRPEWLLTHNSFDLNSDHRLLHDAARIAARPGSPVKRLLAYEVLSSTEWGHEAFTPTTYVQLDEDAVDRKVAALETYRTEVRDWPHPRSAEGIRHLAALRGSQAGMPLAESYRLVWERL